MKIDIHKEVEIESTIRTELLSSMFEVPAKTKLSVTLTGEIPEDVFIKNINPHVKPWHIGLIAGPSGSGKTLLLSELFNSPARLKWGSRSVIDDFPPSLSMEDISRVCQSVGFNTIPSWLRPYSVLSNGERFRVDTAVRLLTNDMGPITIDEFTSVVDRQVAQFACHSIQKYIREKQKQLVVASCHYDIIDWLQPDWILEPGNPCRFSWRSLQPRPPINVSVSRVKYETWNLFRDFHYMSTDLNKAARCYGLFVEASEGLDLQYSNSEFHTPPDRSGDNERDGGRSRIPGPSILSQRGSDSPMVLRQANGVKDSRDLRAESKSVQSTDSSCYESTIEGSSTSSEGRFGRSGKKSGSDVCDKHATSESLSTRKNAADDEDPTILQSQTRSDMDNSERRRSLLHVESNKTPSYRIASMCGVLHRPHPKVSDICGFTRMVTLPDFQGLGLAFVLACKVASAYKALGKRLHSYPNHPAWIRSYQRSSLWMQVKDSGTYSPRRGATSSVGGFGNKRCAVFQYLGPPMNVEDAKRLIYGET